MKDWEVEKKRYLSQGGIDRFFEYARKRHRIYLARQAGKPWPWTDDPILREYRFTNIFRELDRTTIWFKNNVRDPMKREPEVLLATVLFRWFNRITTGETLFCQPDLITRLTPFETYLKTGNLSNLSGPLKKQGPPWTTGSYIINTHGPLGDGKTKLEGVLAQFHAFAKRDWRTEASQSIATLNTLEDMQAWLRQDTLGMGGFMAYEIVSDLRWTSILRNAPDTLTWANPGVGALRGAARVMNKGYRTNTKGKLKPARVTETDAMWLMQHLLKKSKVNKNWPHKWPAWEMREVEHTLCEFDKYERTVLGEGRPRGKFKPGE